MILNLKSPTLKFSVSGLRGVYPQDINPQNVPDLVRAFEKTCGPGPVAVARDNRPTGPAIEEMVCGVLAALGRKVFRCGVSPTPTLKAVVNKKNLAGGIMISASHNPIEYTAFKFIKKKGFFFEKKENDLFLKHLNEKANWGSHTKQGSVEEYAEEAMKQHIDSILSVLPKKKSSKKLKVALDTLGAAATQIAPLLLKEMGISYVTLFENVLPNFPRGPEPVPSALKKLGKFVVEKKCDVGFAFDPDADRLALVGPDGKPLGEELTLPLAMTQALSGKKGKIVVNLSSSYYNEIAAAELNCKVIRSEVGEANVVASMIRNKAVFGGEGNGGVIDPRVPSFGRDSLAAMAWILTAMQNGLDLQKKVQSWPALAMKKTAVKGDKKTYNEYAKRLKSKLKKWKLNTSDGLHFSAPEGLPWIHLRPSNTEPVIRVIAEAASEKELKETLSILTDKK